MAEIVFAPEAVSDLREIKSYITNDLCNEIAAKQTIDKIIKRIRTLSDFPEIGSPLQSIIKFETDYRFLVCANYLAFYRVENNTVHIIRVLYGKRNYMQILFGDIKEE